MSTQQDPWAEEMAPRNKWLTVASVMNNLPSILRFIGACALIIAMYSFLAKGWQSGNDVFRYLLMLGHTGMLAAIGLASGHWLKESKGARLLLTLALVSIPANFAILGAFIFSQAGAAGVDYPNFVAWTVDSMNAALMTTGGALLVLVPVIMLGFTVLARNMSTKLSLLFLVSNAALLLPLRDPNIIGLVVLAITACTIYFSHKAAHKNTSARTQEGITALCLQLLPLMVLLGRNLWLYNTDLFLLTVLSITVFFVMRQISYYLNPQSRERFQLEGLSLIPALAVALLLSSALQVTGIFHDALLFPIGALSSAAMIYDISRRSQYKSDFYRRIAVSVVLLSLIANLILFNGAISAIICIVVGLLLLTLGYKAQQRCVLSGGIILTLLGIVHHFIELVHHFDLGSWASLAVLGIISIIVASTMESHGGKFRPRLETLKEKFNQWDK